MFQVRVITLLNPPVPASFVASTDATVAAVVLMPAGTIPVSSTMSPVEKSEKVPSGKVTTVVVPVVTPTIV